MSAIQDVQWIAQISPKCTRHWPTNANSTDNVRSLSKDSA